LAEHGPLGPVSVTVNDVIEQFYCVNSSSAKFWDSKTA